MSNPWSSILQGAKDLFTREPASESVVGIDVGTSSIKVVQIKKKGGKAILETYGTLALGPYQNQPVGSVTNLPVANIVQAVTDVIRESGVTVTDGGVAIPSNASLVFTIQLPSTISEKELPSIVPIEARKFIPVPISEVLLDYWTIPKQEESIFDTEDTLHTTPKNDILTVAIHNDTITQYKDILAQSHITNSIFELEIFSMIRSVMNNDLAPTLLIDFGASKTKLSIVDYGVVRNFHVIARGGADITRAISQSLTISFQEAEELKRTYGLQKAPESKNIDEIIILSINYIFSEISSVIFDYEKTSGKSISKIIFSGGGSLIKNIITVAQERFSVQVALAEPFSKVEAPVFLNPVLSSIGPEFAVAVGVALRKIQ